MSATAQAPAPAMSPRGADDAVDWPAARAELDELGGASLGPLLDAA